MYNNPYFSLNAQQTKERIDNQIAQLQQMREQIQQPIPQPTNLTQNFQIAPNNQGAMRYANSIDEVNKESVFIDTPFFSKDLSILWIKNANGEVKAYTLAEIVQKDEKDLMIESLQLQLNEMKEMIGNAKSINANVDESVEDEKSSGISAIRANKKK